MSETNYLFNMVGQSQSDVDAIINNQTLYVIAIDDENIHYSENYIPYTIKFMDGDDTILTIVGETGMEVQIPSNLNKEGYVFRGWSTDGIHVISPISNIGDTDIIYKAVWIRPTIVATCNVNESPTDVKICDDTSTIQSIIIDGIELETIKTNYTFKSPGNHEIIYTLKDPTQIGNIYNVYVFRGCSSLTSVTIFNSVTSINARTFKDCSGLTSITIPDSVTSLGYNTFEGCSKLNSVTIPNSVTSIQSNTFSGCSGLTNVTIGNSVTSIDNNAFLNCSSLTSITIPDSVTSIRANAFNGCSGLTSIIIPDSVTSIGYGAFQNCSELTSVIIGNSVTSIDTYIFYNCTKLTSINIPDLVTSIGPGTFYGCSGLTSITIPDSITSISDEAFYSCSGLTSVTIGNSVTSIGNNAFKNCSGLTSIICNATTAPTISYTTFNNIKTGGTLTVPAGSTGYNVWMGNVNHLGRYNWTLVEQ